MALTVSWQAHEALFRCSVFHLEKRGTMFFSCDCFKSHWHLMEMIATFRLFLRWCLFYFLQSSQSAFMLIQQSISTPLVTLMYVCYIASLLKDKRPSMWPWAICHLNCFLNDFSLVLAQVKLPPMMEIITAEQLMEYLGKHFICIINVDSLCGLVDSIYPMEGSVEERCFRLFHLKS